MTAIGKAEASQRAAQALLRARKEALGLETRVEFANWLAAPERLGADAPDESTLGRWEMESRRMPAWFLVWLADELNVSLDRLQSGEPLEPLPPSTLERLAHLEDSVSRILPQVEELLRRRQRRRNSADERPAEASGS